MHIFTSFFKSNKRMLMLLLLIFTHGYLFAQQATVTGVVKTAPDNLGMPGVSVRLKGTAIATSTDANGNFSIKIPAKAGILEFTSVGYKIQEVPVSKTTTLTITLI
jgi:hypothetical protein